MDKTNCNLSIAAGLAVLLSISGCVDMFTARTIATYKVTTTLKDGTVVVKDIAYDSNKTQDGLELDLKEKDGQPTAVMIKVDKASTPDAAIAAAAAALQTAAEMFKQAMLNAAAAGAGS